MDKKSFTIIFRNEKNKETFDLRGHYWFYSTKGIQFALDSECKFQGDGGGTWDKLSKTCTALILAKYWSEIFDLVEEYHKENYL